MKPKVYIGLQTYLDVKVMFLTPDCKTMAQV